MLPTEPLLPALVQDLYQTLNPHRTFLIGLFAPAADPRMITSLLTAPLKRKALSRYPNISRKPPENPLMTLLSQQPHATT